MLTLLLIILGIRILPPPNRALVNGDAGMPVFHHHAPFRRGDLAVFGELGFHGVLDAEGAGGEDIWDQYGK